MPTLTDGTAWEIRMRCEAADDPRVTTVRLEPGYSPAGPCVVATALNREGELVSETVTKPYPPDCIALPEPEGSSALLAGVVACAVLARQTRVGARVRLRELLP